MVAAADDPPLTTIEPHLEMSYNKEMPGEIRGHTRTEGWDLSREDPPLTDSSTHLYFCYLLLRLLGHKDIEKVKKCPH